MVLLFMGCSSDNLSGGGMEDGNATIAGVIHDEYGSAVAGVDVALYTRQYQPGSDTAGVRRVTTDTDGGYELDDVLNGMYNIEAQHHSDTTSLMIPGILITENKPYTVTTGVLQKPGTITFSLKNISVEAGGTVYIPGTSIGAMVDSASIASGLIKLGGVPAGSYSEIIYLPPDTMGDSATVVQTRIDIEPSGNALHEISVVYIKTRVSGRILSADGAGVGNAVVKLVPDDFNPLDGGGVPDSLIAFTDKDGNYVYPSIDTGVYRLEAADPFTGGQSIRDSVRVYGELVLTGVDTLQPTGDLLVYFPEDMTVNAGKLWLTGSRLYIPVDRTVSSDAALSMGNVPVGLYPALVHISGDNMSDTLVVAEHIAVAANEETIIGPYYSWLHQYTLELNADSLGLDFSGVITGFPLLVRLNGNNFNFDAADADGDDLRITNKRGAVLPLEIEFWDRSDKEAEIWVLLDTVFGEKENVLFVYTGKTAVSSLSSGPSVFDTTDGLIGVYHFSGTVKTAGSMLFDASSNANHGIARGGLHDSDNVDGVIGNGLAFDGVAKHMVTTKAYNNPSLYSYSLWFKTLTGQGGKLMGFSISQGDPLLDSTESRYDRHVWMSDTGQIFYGVYRDSLFDSSSQAYVIISSEKLYNDGNWHMIAVDYSQEGMSLFLDGKLIGFESKVGEIADYPGYWKMGYGLLRYNLWLPQPSSEYFEGNIDEVKIYNRLRSAAWLKLEYETQKVNQSVLKVLN
ncbi:MAG: DUF2341 domain-containing protein [Fibrobacteria bacterium]|nr:DUF2341 domain-containing protein [Fibrobacteria bacterium]